MNADPLVVQCLLRALTREESDALAARAQAHLERHGFGLWVVEVPGVADFIGFVGLSIPTFDTPFTPCVEIGWRLASDHWNRGYATEAARAAVAHGFDQAGLREIVSFTVPHNHRSRRVMERLGMTHSPADDFDHPVVPVDHPLRRHVLYRLARSAWRQAATPGSS